MFSDSDELRRQTEYSGAGGGGAKYPAVVVGAKALKVNAGAVVDWTADDVKGTCSWRRRRIVSFSLLSAKLSCSVCSI